MTHASSQVLAFPPASAGHTADYMLHKLSFHADAWDVAEDLRNGIAALVVIVREAGGVFTTLEGGPIGLDARNALAGPAILQAEALALFNP